MKARRGGKVFSESCTRIHSNVPFHQSLAHFFVASVLVISSTACLAASRMGKAVIRDVDGVPCFAVPKNSETQQGVPLFTLVVTKKNTPNTSSRPERSWIFRVEPMGDSIPFYPENCILYGSTPKLAEQELLVSLEPYKIYSVAIQAIPEGSNLRGYGADFCVKPGKDGKLRVHVVPRDEPGTIWRYDVCDKP